MFIFTQSSKSIVMKKILLLSLTLFLSLLSISQTEKLNQLDDKGKKHGKWIIYLDKNWNKLKDSSEALYHRYNYYDHGVSLYPMGPCGKKGWKLESKPVHGSASKFLDGGYKWYDGNGKLFSEHILKNGIYVSCKEYFPTGELYQHFDYTKKCKGDIHGWGAFVYDKNGKLLMTSWMCRDENGEWPKTKD